MKRFILGFLVVLWGTCLVGCGLVSGFSVIYGDYQTALNAFAIYLIVSLVLSPVFIRYQKDIEQIFPKE